MAVLDPGARRRDGTVLPTAYVRDRLLVRGAPASAGLIDDLQKVLEPLGLRVEPSADLPAELAELRGPAAEVVAEHWVSTVVLSGADPATIVDADAALAAVRGAAPQLTQQDTEQVTLDHVLGPAGGQFGGIGGQFGGIGGQFGGIGGQFGGIGGQFGGIGGQFGGIGGQFGGIGSPAEFGVPGRGGRMPVHVGLRNPAAYVPAPARRPVVALVDSGIGRHPWFDGDPTVQMGAELHGLPIGGPNADLGDGIIDPMTGAMAPLAGHGTFIAGIVRQGCPVARLLCIPVFSALGLADEGFVQQTLVLLLARHVEALAAGVDDGVIDVLSLSMGYYHEQSDDPAAAPALRRLLEAYRDAGVIVVAGVGNDAIERPFFPAAFGVGDAVPAVLSVGASNPGGATVALFSNGGDWVRFHRPGAAVVSTMPVTVDAGGEASTAASDRRATLDPDSYACGFGVWSGTSFAAPALAAEAAQQLADLSAQGAAISADDQRKRAGVIRDRLLAEP
ncbi:S8/S53 family peptidase [Calidifontibacter terrae]